MQRYTEIPSSKTLAESLPLILNNDKTGMSCSSGTAFPTTGLIEGMLCMRTDHKKLYQLVDPVERTWRVVADLTGDSRNLDGGFGNAINYDMQNLNSWVDMPTGFYEGSNMLNAPTGDTYWRVIQIRQGDSNGYSSQMAFGANSGKVCMRFQKGGQWSNWQDIYFGADGKVVKNLNADKVDDREPGNAVGNIAVNNGTLNVSLNADMVDGYHVGNESNKVPLSNGTVNHALNADMVDGLHAGNEINNVPINNGNLNKNLNAELLNGMRGSDFVTKNSVQDVAGINTLTVQNINVNGIANIGNTSRRWYNGSSIPHRSAVAVSVKNGVDRVTNIDNSRYWPESSRKWIKETEYIYWTEPNIGGGNYTIYDCLQALIANSHRHHIEEVNTYRDCNCNCNCDCNGGDDRA